MQSDAEALARRGALSPMMVCTAAGIALAVAMGIGRFAFTPMLPLMVRDGSLSLGDGAWIAASNYLGYLVGALVAARLRMPSPALMRASLAGIVVTTAAMGLFDGVPVWNVLRWAAGVFSAWAMIAVSAWALPRLAAAARSELSGFIYAGVGIGIAFAGLFCLVSARPGVAAAWLWLELGGFALLAAAVSAAFTFRPGAARTQSGSQPVAALPPGAGAGLVISYGAFGFGYILPATFLPALAREIWDDPQVFGLAWPIFGTAAALSTIAVARWSAGINRLRLWAICHAIMASGVVLPSLWLSPAVIVVAALAVGGTFVVVTMIGMQEARERSAGDPTKLLAAMTAAFAVGQLAGPLVSGAIDLVGIGHRAALGHALRIAAFALAVSGIGLWRQSRRGMTT